MPETTSNDPSIINAERPQAPEVSEINQDIDQTFRLLEACLTQKAIQKSHSGELQLDTQEITNISHSLHEEWLDEEDAIVNSDQDYSNIKVDTPEDFDWNMHARRAIRDTVNILLKSQLVDRETLVNASRFAAPGNTNVVDEFPEGYESSNLAQLDLGFYGIRHMLRNMDFSTGKRKSDLPIPIPPSKQIRNEHIRLDIKKSAIIGEARSIVFFTQRAGFTVSDEQALELSMLRFGAHEYAHALERALQVDKRFEVNDNTSVSMQKWERDMRSNSLIHSEHFVRGIEAFVLRKKMLELGFNNEQIESYYNKISEIYTGSYAKQAQSLFECAQRNGLTLAELINVDHNIRTNKEINLKYGSDKDPDSLRTNLAYNTPEYDLQQIQIILAENKDP